MLEEQVDKMLGKELENTGKCEDKDIKQKKIVNVNRNF